MKARDALAFALLCGCAATLPVRAAEDIYDAAVQHPGRSSQDLQRDVTDRPAEVLRISGIKPGMRVADVLAGDGYYSELLSYIVGPSGHVLLLNNPPFEKWGGPALPERMAKQRLPNVEQRTVDLAHMGLGTSAFDAIILIKVYHDLYWIDPEGTWPKVDVPVVLDQIAGALKPHGILLVVDHSAKPHAGTSVASSLHRIDEAYARSDFQAHGFEFVRSGDFLRKPSDPRTQISYKPPILGKTDRFVLVFRKRGG